MSLPLSDSTLTRRDAHASSFSKTTTHANSLVHTMKTQTTCTRFARGANISPRRAYTMMSTTNNPRSLKAVRQSSHRPTLPLTCLHLLSVLMSAISRLKSKVFSSSSFVLIQWTILSILQKQLTAMIYCYSKGCTPKTSLHKTEFLRVFPARHCAKRPDF